ncbi:MAG: D-alanyl-D-alanine carboxypeptidase/D-alanyl-D-alanine-endopeptidase [Verrucomicrobiota bacterium]
MLPGGTFPAAGSAVEAEAERLKAKSAWKSATVGVCLVRVSDGQVVASYNADASLVPASTMKAVTTASGLELLGPDFRFETKLALAGTVDENGTLDGDVVIVGGGDPTLGEGDLYGPVSQWRAALEKAGIKKVTGRIVADQSAWETALIPRSWVWEDIGNYYASGACALNYHANEYRLNFAPGRTGAIARFTSTSPRVEGVTFFNEMRTGAPGSGDQGYVFGAPYSDVRYLRGTVPGGRSSFSIRGSLPDPPLFLAGFFKKYLEGKGIAVEGEATTSRLLAADGEKVPTGEVLDTRRSSTLGALIRKTNHDSVNIRAEAILKAIGKEVKQDGSTKAGAAAVTAHWKAQGVALAGFDMADGSGLSRVNLLSARQLAGLMRAMAQSEHFDAFYQSLPVAGRSGTLRSIGGGTAAEGRVVGKSGTINRIKCYTGYVNGRSGTRYAFAILVNNYAGTHGTTVSYIASLMAKMAVQ